MGPQQSTQGVLRCHQFGPNSPASPCCRELFLAIGGNPIPFHSSAPPGSAGEPLAPAQPPFLLPSWLHSAPCQQQHLPFCKVSQAWVTSTCRTGCHSRDFGVPNPVTPFDNLQFPYPACPAVGEFRLWQKLCLPSEGLKTPTRSADSSLSTKREKHGHQRGFFSPPCPSPLPATDPTGLIL